MRRLLFLALFVALVAGMGFSQPAITGMFQYGVMAYPGFAPEQDTYGKLIVTEPLDKFNTIVFRFRWKDLNAVNGENNDFTDIDKFYLQSDVTGSLGVTGPVSFKLGFGIQDPNGADLTNGISPFEVSDLSGNDVGGAKQATIYPVFTFNNMVNVGAIIAPGPWNVDATMASYNSQGYEVFANGGQGPVMVEVGYGNLFRQQYYPIQQNAAGTAAAALPVNNGEPLKFMWAAANFKQTQGDLAYAVAVNGQYNLNSDGAGFMLRNHYAAYEDPTAAGLSDVNWGYGVAGSVTYQKNYTAKVGLVGIEGSPANRLEAQIIAVLDPKLTLDAGAVFNLNTDYTAGAGADMLNDATVAATVNLGLANLRIGWLFIDKNAAYSVMSDDIGRIGDVNGPSYPSQGVFVESIINF